MEKLERTFGEVEEVALEENHQKKDGEELEGIKEVEEEVTPASEVIDENEGTDEDMVVLDIKSIRAADAEPSSKAVSKGSNFRIINTQKNGRRITLQKGLIDYLGTEEIEIGFTDTSIVLAAAGTGISKEVFKLKVYGKSQYVLYNTPLVLEITNFFELDFSNTTTRGLVTKEIKLTGGMKAIEAGL